MAPKSFPVRSCIVLMAKSRFRAFWLPCILPSPATRSWRVLNIRFLNWWLSSTNRWSMPIILKSTISSFRFSISYCNVLSFTSKFCFLTITPFSMPLEISLPCDSKAARFSSTLSSSACRISFCISGDCGIIPNWSWVRITQSQSLFLISPKMRKRFLGVKSSLPGYRILACG